MATYNIDQIVSIKCYDKIPSNLYTIYQSTGFFGTKSPEWRVRGIINYDVSLEEFMQSGKEKYAVDNNILYEKVSVDITFSNRESKTVRFDTYSEAKVFKDRLLSQIKNPIEI